MRKHGRAMIEGAGLLLVGLLLFLFPEESVAAAREGISLCVDVLIPSLFPFFVISSLLISTGLAGLCARPLESFMRPLFGVGGAGAAALSLGLIGGYPVGARTVAQLVQVALSPVPMPRTASVPKAGSSLPPTTLTPAPSKP